MLIFTTRSTSPPDSSTRWYQDIPYDWTIHDYYTICPRVNLVNVNHSYCGEPDVGGCNRCLASLGDDQGRSVHDRSRTGGRRTGFFCVRLAGSSFRLSTFAIASNDTFRIWKSRCGHIPKHCPSWKAWLPFLHRARSRIAVIGRSPRSRVRSGCSNAPVDASRGLPLEFHVIGSTDRNAVFSHPP